MKRMAPKITETKKRTNYRTTVITDIKLLHRRQTMAQRLMPMTTIRPIYWMKLSSL